MAVDARASRLRSLRRRRPRLPLGHGGSRSRLHQAQARSDACFALRCLTVPCRLTHDAEYASVVTGRVSGESLGWRLDGVGQLLRADGARFCTTCHVWRPRLAAHCGECGHCVTRHDHHCGVMGTCVAQRNHVPFAVFLCAAVAGSVILFAATAAQLYAMKFPWTAGSWRRWEVYPHAVLLVFYLFPCFMQGFAGMHVIFLCRDMTTNEMIKARRRRTAAALAGGAAPEPEPPVVVDRSSTRVFCLEFRSRRAFEKAWAAMQQQPQEAPALPAANGDTAALPA
jgi:hypothetical protein